MSRNSFFPAFGADASSFGDGALALLGAGSVALTSIQLLAGFSRRQPVTATIATLSVLPGVCAAAAVTAPIPIEQPRTKAVNFISGRILQYSRDHDPPEGALRSARGADRAGGCSARRPRPGADAGHVDLCRRRSV